MLQTAPFETHVKEYEAWFEKYEAVFQSEMNAVKRQFEYLPENINGIEVGLGTGRYAMALGIKEGVEPVAAMRELAIKREMEVMDAAAEDLPYRALHFDFVLFVTICHLNNVRAAFKEAYRVLKRDGSIIVGFIDKNGQVGKSYVAKRDKSHFYKNATFYSVDEVIGFLKEAGFRNLGFVQTLFRPLDEIEVPEEVKEGYGEGSFIVVRADKNL